MPIATQVLASDALLFLTAAIWGFAFVAQRVGMDSIGPYAYNGIRYAIGALVLLPLIRARRKARAGISGAASAAAAGQSGAAAEPLALAAPKKPFARKALPVAICGSAMFLGASLQQLGLVTTTAGNAAFVTSLYVVIVPLLGFAFGKKAGLRDAAAAVIAVAGLYVITIGKGFSMAPGDLLVLAGSFFWALHILVIARFSTEIDPVELSAGQFAVCSLLSAIAALVTEPHPFAGALAAAIPILYGGVLSCGVAFTLQIVAQRRSPPAHASILLSFEGLFGAIGGVLILREPATARLFVGGGLMFAAALLSQLPSRRARRK